MAIFDLVNMSSLPKGQGPVPTLYRSLPITAGRDRPMSMTEPSPWHNW